MKKTAYIVTGGSLSFELLKERMEKEPESIWIAVDGALEVTDRLGLQPDYIIGDFDTVSEAILKKYPEDIILRHPPHKDRTDTELAVETAVEIGCSEIGLFGAVGSRMDHSLANIFLLQKFLEKKISVTIYDENNKLYLKESGFHIERAGQYGKFVSLLPLTERVENVTLNGFQYSLENVTFYRETTLGVSNEITEETATVTFENGIFIVVESKDK